MESIKASEVSSKKSAAPAVIGSVLEWYDFSLYSYLAPILASLFFPAQNKTVSLLATFSVFAVSYVMRPIGAVIFGHIGDRIGRRITLIISIIMMALVTVAIGLLPTYEQIGIYASIGLIVARLLQGLTVGGEFSGAAIFLVEHAPANRRGFFGSWTLLSIYGGMLIASLVCLTLSSFLNSEDLSAWGWRIPFLLGGLFGIIGLYLRIRMSETPDFLLMQAEEKVLEVPFIHTLKKFLPSVISAVCLAFLPAAATYLILVYFPSYLVSYLNIPLSQALLINTISLSILVCLIPMIGHLSDKIGRRPLLITGAILFCLFSYPLFIFLGSGTVTTIAGVIIVFSIMLCISESMLPAIFAEMFPANIRCTAMSLSHNFANGVFGGTFPLIATYMVYLTGSLVAPSFYLILLGSCTLCVAIRMNKPFAFNKDNVEKKADKLVVGATV